LAQADQPGFQRDMALLAEHDLVLDLLIGPEHWAAMLALARQLPHLRIVINHIGLMPITGVALEAGWLERYAQAAAAPNITMKVSGLLENSVIRPAPTVLDFYRPTLDALWATFGADRLIYGSNWPVCEIAGEYATCLNLVKGYFAEKGAEATAKYFWQNAQQVYKFA
jgi:L-fuconolactonase